MSRKGPNTKARASIAAKFSKTTAARKIVVAHAKAAADAMSEAAGDAPIDPEEDFGGDLEEDELEQELPPLPSPSPVQNHNASPSNRAAPAPPNVLDLGKPPADPLAAQNWLYQINVALAYDAITDKDMSPRERRKEVRTISAAASRLMPHARLFEAEQLIRRDRRELEEKTRDKMGAKLEKRPTPTTNVIAFRKP